MNFCEESGVICPNEPERIYCPQIDRPCPYKKKLADCISHDCPKKEN